jgi:hypothetical protein
MSGDKSVMPVDSLASHPSEVAPGAVNPGWIPIFLENPGSRCDL